jgi:hypothetical protein
MRRRRGGANTSSGRTERHQAVADLLATAPAALSPLAGYVPAMTNAFGVELDRASVRRAAVERVPETAIAWRLVSANGILKHGSALNIVTLFRRRKLVVE